MVISLIITPIIIKVSFKFNLVDRPNYRKVHTKPVSVMGGTVILLSFLIGLWLGHPIERAVKPLVIGLIIMYFVGIIDDIYDLKPILKLIGQIIAASVVVFYGITIDFISFPIGPTIHFGILSIPITIIWIVAITNAINLIDGLDGFIGFLSLLGFKNITFISLFFPIVILAVPFIDTLFAMIRRVRNGQHIMQADKSHLHHKLLALGYTHRQTVLLIYSIAIMFSLSSIILYLSQPLGVLLMFILIVITIELIVEFTGLIDDSYRPILNLISKKNDDASRHKTNHK